MVRRDYHAVGPRAWKGVRVPHIYTRCQVEAADYVGAALAEPDPYAVADDVVYSDAMREGRGI
jgi:hypothetical protein